MSLKFPALTGRKGEGGIKESSESTALLGKTIHAEYLCTSTCVCIYSSYRAVSKPCKDLL